MTASIAPHADEEMGLTQRARGSFKALGLAAQTVRHILLIPPNASQPQLVINAKRWADDMLKVVDIRVEIEGELPRQGLLQVCNHRSFMDILVLLSASPGVFLAKAEIEGWPIIGTAARLAGTVFVKREERGSRKEARKAMAGVLNQGVSVTVFPEGTTGAPPGTLKFRPGSFEVAAELGTPIQLIAMEYPRASDCWINNEPIGAYFMRVFCRPMTVRVRFGPVLEGRDSEALCQLAQEWVREQLEDMGEQPDM